MASLVQIAFSFIIKNLFSNINIESGHSYSPFGDSKIELKSKEWTGIIALLWSYLEQPNSASINILKFFQM